MKPLLSLFLTVAVSLSASSCCNSAGNVTGMLLGNSSVFVSNPDSKRTVRTVKIDHVDELSTSAGLNVTYVVSNENKVTVNAPQDIQDKITVSAEDGNLKIGLTQSVRNISKLATITVMAPSINSFDASSGSTIALPQGFQPSGSELELEASSGAIIKGNGIRASVVGVETSSGSIIELNVTTESVACSSSSGSSISITGTSEAVSLVASSGSSVNAGNLKAKTGKASASSGSSITCSIASPTKISKSSGGSVSNY